MKKQVIAIIIATAAMGCSQNSQSSEDDTRIPISFSAAVGKPTKGTDATIAIMKTTGNAIGLFTYTGLDGYPGGTNSDHAIAANYRMYWNDTDSKWMVTDDSNNPITFFWPASGSNNRFSFYGYYPRGSANITNITPSSVGPTVTTPASFTLTVPTTVANQIDLLTTRNEPPAPVATVALPFNHATTKFSFQAQTNVREWRVTIHSVSLTGINDTGKYTFATQTPPATVNANWSGQSGNQTYQVPMQGGGEITLDFLSGGFVQISSTAAGESMFLIPQDLRNNGNTPILAVTYSIVNSGTGSTIAANITKDLYIGNPNSVSDGELNTLWAKGRIMNYQLTFTTTAPGTPGSPIDFDVTLNEWNMDNNPFN